MQKPSNPAQTTLISFNPGAYLPLCSAIDLYTLISTTTLVLDFDTSQLPYTFAQSAHIVNSNWTDATQSLMIMVLNSTYDVVQTLTFSSGMYSMTNPCPGPSNRCTNETFYFLYFLKNCIYPDTYDSLIKASTFNTNLAMADNKLRANVRQVNLYVSNCSAETITPIINPASINVQIYGTGTDP